MNTDADLLIDATTSALDAGSGLALQQRALDNVATRLTSTVEAVGWVAPTTAASLEVLHSATDYPAVLAHPTLRYLLAAVRRSVPDRPDRIRDFLSYGLADFAWPRQLRDGLGTSTWLCRLDGDGGLRAGGLGVFFEFGSGYANEEVLIDVDQDRAKATMTRDGLTVEILPSDMTGPGHEDPPTPEIHGFAVTAASRTQDGTEISARDAWLRPRLTGTNQRTDGTEFFSATWEHYRREPHTGAVEAGLNVIRQVWPEAAQEIALFDRTIVPLSTDRSAYRAFTVLSRQGAVFVGDAPPLPMAEMLLHETAHVKLRQMQLLNPLLVNPLDESERVKVPWRPDPRPMPGILEGLFVFTHVAELEARLLDRGSDAPQVAERLIHLMHAREILARKASLTQCGRQFLDVLGDWVAELGRKAELSSRT